MLIGYLRAAVIYLLLILVFRLMGKRQIGQMEPAEFVLALLIADLAAVPMQDPGIPLLYGLIPITVIVCLAILLSVLSYNSIPIRRLLCGKPVILIEKGTVLQQNLKKTRLTLDELTEHLREKGITELSAVYYAVLETNGQISAIPCSAHQPPTASDLKIKPKEPQLPVTLISNGYVIADNLRKAGYDRSWLHEHLKKRGAKAEETFLLAVDDAGTVIYIRKEKG